MDACGQRSVAELANFNFNLHYTPGPTNIDTDALSRIKWPDVSNDQERQEKFKHLPQDGKQEICLGAIVHMGFIDNLAFDAQVIPQPAETSRPIMTKDDWLKAQASDPDILQIAICLKEGADWSHLKGTPTYMHYVRIRKYLVLRDCIVYRRIRASKDPPSPLCLPVTYPFLVKERLYWYHQSSQVSDYIKNCRV